MDGFKEARYSKALEDLRSISVEDSSELEDILKMILDVVSRAVHAEAATLWYYTKALDGKIHPKATYGLVTMDSIELLPGEGLAGQCIEDGESKMIRDCQNDPQWSNKSDSKSGFVTKSMIITPLTIAGERIGCFQLINKTDNELYEEEDLEFLKSLSESISVIFAGGRNSRKGQSSPLLKWYLENSVNKPTEIVESLKELVADLESKPDMYGSMKSSILKWHAKSLIKYLQK